MSKMARGLLRRNRDLLATLRAPSNLLSQATGSHRSQLQPSAKSLSDDYVRANGSDDIEEQNTESLVESSPTPTRHASNVSRDNHDRESHASIRPAHLNDDLKGLRNNTEPSQLVPLATLSESLRKNQGNTNISESVNAVESDQYRKPNDEKVVTDRDSRDVTGKAPSSILIESKPVVKKDGDDASSSESARIKLGQSEGVYIDQLKKIMATHQADLAENTSAIDRVEAALADTRAGVPDLASVSPNGSPQKPLLPNRNTESLASPRQAKRRHTRVNIGSINVEVIEPKTSATAQPASTRRQTTRPSRKSYQAQSGVRKHFGLGQL